MYMAAPEIRFQLKHYTEKVEHKTFYDKKDLQKKMQRFYATRNERSITQFSAMILSIKMFFKDFFNNKSFELTKYFGFE